VAAFCSQCGAPLTPNTHFCAQCGTPVAGAASAPSAPPPGPGAAGTPPQPPPFQPPPGQAWNPKGQSRSSSNTCLIVAAVIVLFLLFAMRGCFFLRLPLRLLRHVSIEHHLDVRAGLGPVPVARTPSLFGNGFQIIDSRRLAAVRLADNPDLIPVTKCDAQGYPSCGRRAVDLRRG
jgi:zinc ribbon protein